MRAFLKQKNFFSICAISLLTISLMGCDSTDDEDPSTVATIDVTLDGMQASIATPATSTAKLAIDTRTGALSGNVTVTGLDAGNDITSAHIHLGNPGVSGDAIVTLVADDTLSSTQWNIPVNTTLSAENLAIFMAGGTYLNIHTDTVAAGEVRGQILPENYEITMTALSGDQQVPVAITSTLTATSYTLLNTKTGVLKARLKLSDGTTVTNGVHIHTAFAGTTVATPTVILAVDSTDNSVYEASDTLSSSEIADYKAGKFYINAHTTANAAGELRGQILPSNISMVRSTLNRAQIASDLASTATAIGYVTLNKTTGAVVSNIRVSDMTGNAAHIHEGASGATGDSVLTFTANGDDANLYEGTGTLDLTKFNAEGYYYNVHSVGFPAGEIRGQITP